MTKRKEQCCMGCGCDCDAVAKEVLELRSKLADAHAYSDQLGLDIAQLRKQLDARRPDTQIIDPTKHDGELTCPGCSKTFETGLWGYNPRPDAPASDWRKEPMHMEALEYKENPFIASLKERTEKAPTMVDSKPSTVNHDMPCVTCGNPTPHIFCAQTAKAPAGGTE